MVSFVVFSLYCLFSFYYELSVFISLGPFNLCESLLSYHTAGKEGKFSCPLSFCSGWPSGSMDSSHQPVSGKPPGGYPGLVSSLFLSVDYWCL